MDPYLRHGNKRCAAGVVEARNAAFKVMVADDRPPTTIPSIIAAAPNPDFKVIAPDPRMPQASP